MPSDRPLTCSDLEAISGKPRCCADCHDRYEIAGAGSGLLPGDLLGDGVYFRVCCHVEMWLRDNGVNVFARRRAPTGSPLHEALARLREKNRVNCTI